MRLAEILLNALNQFAHARAVRFRPTAKFAPQVFGE
jgi:hypothetical protein